MDDAVAFPIDPVIEAYKKDLDLTLIRRNLQRSPEERILAVMDMNRLVEEMRRGLKDRATRD